MVQNKSIETPICIWTNTALKFRPELDSVFFELWTKFRGHSRATPFSFRRSFLSTLTRERNFQIFRPLVRTHKERKQKSCDDGVARLRALPVDTKRFIGRRKRRKRRRSLRPYRFRSRCALQRKLSTRRISRRRRRGKTTTMVLKWYERNWTKSFGVPRRVLILLLLLITTREAATRD